MKTEKEDSSDEMVPRISLSLNIIPDFPLLSRELLLLSLMSLELTNSQIASRFGISERAMNIMQRAMMEKSGVNSLFALITFARKNNLIS